MTAVAVAPAAQMEIEKKRDRSSTIYIGRNRFNIRHNNINDGIAHLRLTMGPELYHTKIKRWNIFSTKCNE